MDEKEQLNLLTEKIIGDAIKVRKALGPGLLESTYEACLVFELVASGLQVERQKPLPVVYRNVHLDCGYRVDLLVEDSVIVEIKSMEHPEPIHKAQVLSYLKLSDRKVGLLINFNVQILKNGIEGIVNNFSDSPRSQRALR